MSVVHAVASVRGTDIFDPRMQTEEQSIVVKKRIRDIETLCSRQFPG